MKKRILARQLRLRQVESLKDHTSIAVQLGITTAQIAAITDDGIIDAYITCHGCGHKETVGIELAGTIARATSADNWFTVLEALPKTNHHHH